MRKLFRILLFCFISCQQTDKKENNLGLKNSNAQSEFKKIKTNNSLELEYQILDKNNEQIEFSRLTKLAEYPGGFDSLAKFIQRNFKFPESTENIDIKGIVKTTFSVDTLGKVVEVELVKGLMKEIDQSCLDVISKMPDWKAAEIGDNQKVKMKFGLPLKFVTEDDGE